MKWIQGAWASMTSDWGRVAVLALIIVCILGLVWLGYGVQVLGWLGQ